MIADSLPDTFGHIIFQEWLRARGIQKVTPLEQLLQHYRFNLVLVYLGDLGMGALEYKSSFCHAKFISASLIINFTILLLPAVNGSSPYHSSPTSLSRFPKAKTLKRIYGYKSSFS